MCSSQWSLVARQGVIREDRLKVSFGLLRGFFPSPGGYTLLPAVVF